VLVVFFSYRIASAPLRVILAFVAYPIPRSSCIRIGPSVAKGLVIPSLPVERPR